MFHVEQSFIQKKLSGAGIALGSDSIEMLNAYVGLILQTSGRVNITGLRNAEEIAEALILGSIAPLWGLSVPRGTLVVDIGTGAGVPGLPLAISMTALKFHLVDSTQKKIVFVQMVVDELALENVGTQWGRVEDVARGTLRGGAGVVVSRGVGPLHYVMELGAPLLDLGGILFVYSREYSDAVSSEYGVCAKALGLDFIPSVQYGNYGIPGPGVLLRKVATTSDLYPRRVAVIKREGRKYASREV